MFNFPTWIPDCGFHSPALFVFYFFLLTLVFVLQLLCLPWEILIMLYQFSLIFHQTQEGMPHFIAWLVTILMLIGSVFIIIWEIFHRRIYLNSVLLLLLVNFVGVFRLELMYIPLILNIKANLTYTYAFQLLVLLPYFIQITF